MKDICASERLLPTFALHIDIHNPDYEYRIESD